MTKISKQNLRIKSKKWVSKLPISEHVKMSISSKKYFSKNEDKLPMLPPSSDEDSDELSPIEEEHSSSSGSNDSQSRYASTFFETSTSSLSSESEVSSYKHLNDEYGTPTDNEFSELEASSVSGSSVISQNSVKVIRPFKTANMNYDEIEVDVQHGSKQLTKTHTDPSREHGTGSSTVIESMTVIQHIAQVHGEMNEETLVEVDEEVPFESLMSGFAERIRDERNDDHSSIYDISPSATVNELLSTIINMIGLNRSKTFMFVMMNLSLIAANANQLKHLLNSEDRTILFYVSLGLLGASFFFQLIAKICSITSCGEYDTDYSTHVKKLKCLHKFTSFLTVMIFITNLVLTGVTFAEFLKEFIKKIHFYGLAEI